MVDVRSPGSRTSGRHEPSSPKRFREDQRIAHAADRLGRVSPQRASLGERADGLGMILEVRKVHDRVTFDGAGGAGRRARRKRAARARRRRTDGC